MRNKEKYNEVFIKLFSLNEDFDARLVKINETENWDSVGHMELITRIEDAFDIMLDTEDILNFTSYQNGAELLKKYGIELA